MRRFKKKGLLLHLFKTPQLRNTTGIISVFSCLFTQCVFNGTVNEQPLTMMSLDANGDTLSVFPRLRFVFSSPLADTSVPVSFSPAISSGYGAYLNTLRDTLTIDFMEMLEGNTRYVLKLGRTVSSIDGSVWDLSDDSTVFYTYPREQEINDTKDVADSLRSVIFGIISDVSDIDAFVCIGENIRAVYLQSIGAQDSFFIEDARSNIIVAPKVMKQTDTILISGSNAPPVYIFVRSGIKGFEGKYKLGVINK
jgi:hypothetical protein